MRNLFLTLILISLSVCGFSQTNYYYSSPNVYVSGTYIDGSTQTACYWKNNQPILLKNFISADAISVEDGRVYTVVDDGEDSYFKPIYCYANGEIKSFSRSSYGSFSDMVVCNNRLYVTLLTPRVRESTGGGGWRSIDICATAIIDINKWTTYDIQINEGGGRSIAAYDNMIYSIESNRGRNGYIAYGQYVPLEGSLSEITVAYGIVYIAGSFKSMPCYWLDGYRKEILLPDNASGAYMADIATLSNGRVHGIVWSNSISYYWAGDKYWSIPGADGYKKIKVFNDKIYVLGYVKRGPIRLPCYWVLSENESGGMAIEKEVILKSGKYISDIVVTNE